MCTKLLKKLPLLLILLFSVMNLNAQSYYEIQWEKIKTFDKERKPKSAQKIVTEIEKKAISESNIEQEIKALLYQSKYSLETEEDAQKKIIGRFEEKLSTSSFPIKNILHHHLAKILWDYVKRNTWKIYDRTYTDEKIVLTDFEEWDIKTFEKVIHEHYSSSLKNSTELKKQSLENYKEILISGKYGKEDEGFKGVSLYETLQNSVLTFYKSGGLNVTQPVQEFTASNAKYLANTEAFLKEQLPTTTNFSSELEALKAYQNLLKYYQKRLDAPKFMSLDLDRINYVSGKYSNPDEKPLLKKTLNKNIENYSDFDFHGVYLLKYCEIIISEAENAQLDEETRWYKKNAVTLLNSFQKSHPNATGINEEMTEMIENIKRTHLNVESENYWIPNKANKALLTYRNLNKVKLSYFPITREQELEIIEAKKRYRNEDRKLIKKFASESKVNSSTITVKNEEDYLVHKTEVPIPKLNGGIYIIGFSEENSEDIIQEYNVIHVTELAINEVEGNFEYYIVNRKTGAPVKNARVTANYKVYHSYNDQQKKEAVLTSDKNGKIKLKERENIRDLILTVSLNKKNSYFNLGYSSKNNYNERERKANKNFLFTDRAIYRPGQTVYFKGIIVRQDGDITKTLTNETGTVILKNVNRQEVSKLQIKTNEYGSYSGSFVLPSTGLNGNFQLNFFSEKLGRISGRYHNIKVEEYKRPKFFVEFSPVKGNYKLNDKVIVSGKAESYAGSNITDASVKYKIVRNERIYRPWYYRSYYNNSPGQVVDNGEVKMKDDGTFEIEFKSSVDDGKEDQTNLIYTYSITADVTDLNGETHSSTTSVEIGNIALKLGVGTSFIVQKQQEKTAFHVTSSNLNGQFLASDVEVKVFKLKAPEKAHRKKPLATPDYKYWTEEEYASLFPYESYSESDSYRNWDKGKNVFSTAFNTQDKSSAEISEISNWETGMYIITVSGKDKSGINVENASYFELKDLTESTPSDNKLFEVYNEKSSYTAGESGEVLLKTSAPKLNVLVQIEKYGKIISTEWIELKQKGKTVKFNVEEKDKGSFSIHYSFVYENSFYSDRTVISIPEPDRNLKVETITFRDKITPGAKETWKFKVSGPDGEKITAEILASMYDQSLDEFAVNHLNFNPFTSLYIRSIYSFSSSSFGTSNYDGYRNQYTNYSNWTRDLLINDQIHFDFFGLVFGRRPRVFRSYDRTGSVMRGGSTNDKDDDSWGDDEDSLEESAVYELSVPAPSLKKMDGSANGYISELEKPIKAENQTTTSNSPKKEISPRKNLQETAFFYPHIETDEEGNFIFSFNSPEAMTTWKLQLLGHTKDAKSFTYSAETKTQKEIFVSPNAPRFLREGDTIIFQSKITNLTENKLSGEAELLLFDAFTNKKINSKLVSGLSSVPFNIKEKGNTVASWKLTIPDGLQSVRYQVLAKAGDFTDGEENFIPVLTNRKLVTETMPLWVRGNQTKTFTLDKLKNSSSSTLKQHKLTLEMTSNPAWYAVQSLPYLMEYPYECAEQTFARYYANAIGSHIVNSNPRIKQVFDQWKSSDQLISNLEKNQELKSIIIAETPWLRDAQSETEQQKRIALLFDLNTLSDNLNSALNKLNKKQNNDGSWSWFDGGRPNRYITQHIMQGFGHLKNLQVQLPNNAPSRKQQAFSYLENEFIKDYEWMKNHASCLECNHLSSVQLQYLYMTTLWNIRPSSKAKEATKYYVKQIKDHWTSLSLYNQGLSALVSAYYFDINSYKLILASLKERAIQNEELGMYWKENTNSWSWYESNIETQALLIEVFTKLENDTKTIDELKVWLLKNKQTNRWKTTKATTEAVYALLMRGTEWLNETEQVEVQVGNEKIKPTSVQAGTGYFKTSWSSSEIKPEMATVKIDNPKSSIAWGGMYWQYFEDLDKITSAKTPLTLEKQLFLKTETDAGEKLIKITPDTKVNVGDLIKVRITLTSDRDMEFIHMKDMRSSGLEPTSVISRYKWQDGLGYYQETKDVSTNFFFDNLRKGTYVFEYNLRANNAGNFSNGITTIQSMYAPEFTSHSKGTRLEIK